MGLLLLSELATTYVKHLPGLHDQKVHGRAARRSPVMHFSVDRRPIPKEDRDKLQEKVLSMLGAKNVPIKVIKNKDDPALREVFSEELAAGKSLPKYIDGHGPELDFGGGDVGVPYGIYDDGNGIVYLFEEVYNDGELAFARALAHETTHHFFNKVKQFDLAKNKKTIEENTRLGKQLSEKDGVTRYSTHYWNIFYDFKHTGKMAEMTLGDLTFDDVVNETLSEMSAIKISNPKQYELLDPTWKRLHARICKKGKQLTDYKNVKSIPR